MPLLTTLKEFLAGLTVREILEYYAMLCIILMPFAFGILIYLSKKTSAIERLNRFLDRILGLEEAKTPPASDKKEEKKDENTDEKKAEEDDEKSGIIKFNILVGDTYFCRVDSVDTSKMTKGLSWFSTNRFVADIDKESGKLTAKKNGSAIIIYTDKNVDYDPGRSLYNISVVQRNPDWFADRAIELLYKDALRDEVANAFIDRKILSESKVKKTVTYEGLGGEKKIVFQFSSGNRLRRVLWEFDQGNVKEDERGGYFGEELDQRFEKVEGKGDVTIWIREYVDERRDEVQFYAFAKRTSRKTVILGIGKTWREYGDVEEFLMNISMCEKTFVDCTDGEPVSGFAVDEEYARKKSVDAAKDSGLENVTNVPHPKDASRKPEQTENDGTEKPEERQEKLDEEEKKSEKTPTPEPPADPSEEDAEGQAGEPADSEGTESPIDADDIPDTAGAEQEEENENPEETPENPAEDVDFDERKEMIGMMGTDEDFDKMYPDHVEENE